MLDEAKFMELARAKYAKINELEKAPTMLDYELGMRELMTELTRSIMEEQLGGASSDRRKKKAKLPPSAK